MRGFVDTLKPLGNGGFFFSYHFFRMPLVVSWSFFSVRFLK
ncbi:hypothetical protein CHCC14809_1886 [Bacillus licheniformis]|nr:hypothetical protein CHCC15087_1195 [Bacillus licheniformis]TWM72993.1 hypothetical protein CHCC14809_1886 [Bacillus licheniformis]TWM91716.1 hypothetical protein CHCC14596_3981 [Bacillus licheniformis]TWO12467.1 hypothetical protein CHCC14431_2957 [Bacillus licheniformis]